MDEPIAIAAVVAMLFAAGGLIALAGGRVTWRWIAIAAALVVLNDALLTRLYGLLPSLPGHWNWTGKSLALVATLAIATLPAFGWRHSGLTLAQAPRSLRACLPVALLYCALFVGLALVFPNGGYTREELAFQLTMPGLEEEPFYRGILLLALDRAFLDRRRFGGVDWGWGAIVSCALFGLAHAFGVAHGTVSFDPLTMALTALPSLIGVWLRLRSGSVALPILIHNFGNTIPLVL